MKKRSEITVVVAAPSDVRNEKSALRDIITDLNEQNRTTQDCTIELRSWDTDAHPRFHVGGAQGAIDEDLRIEDCDILIGIFGARFGTLTADNKTGTEHEIANADEARKKSLDDRPWVSLYFHKQPPIPQTVDGVEQWRRVLAFKTACFEKGLIKEYEDLQDFVKQVRGLLVKFVRTKIPSTGPIETPRPSVSNWDTIPFGQVDVHTFDGLQREPVETDVFQDFVIDDGRIDNPNPVSYLWADACGGGNTISAVLDSEDGLPHLRISFDNKPRTYSSNIGIRPVGERAVLTKGNRYLSFDARVDKDPADLKALDEVFCGARVVDRWLQHWAYGPQGRYRPLKITKSWPTQVLDLGSREWWLFPADGNRFHGPAKPDFSIISSLVLEFGSDNIDRPGQGHSTVLIRKCVFTSVPPPSLSL
jgi:hypothetical protein